jgi:hypothetical protein
MTCTIVGNIAQLAVRSLEEVTGLVMMVVMYLNVIMMMETVGMN